MRRRARGFTLIEVMMALLVSVVGLLGTLALILSLIGGTSFTRNLTEASVLVQSQIEAVNSQVITMSTPQNGPIVETGLDASGNGPASPFPPNPPGLYMRTTTWGVTADGLRRSVQVNVSWTDSRGAPHSVSATEERIP